MKTATGLTLVAAGAILAFAVTEQIPYFNIQVAGWVLILIGSIGLAVPRERYSRLRERTRRYRPAGASGADFEEVEEITERPQLFSPLLMPGGIDAESDALLRESNLEMPGE